jgi:hypothetical protein
MRKRSAVNTLERLEAAADVLDRISAGEWSRRGDVCWISGGDSDEGIDWCHPCATAEAERLRKKHPDTEFFVGRACGACEAERSCACDKCGAPMTYSLLRYGVISEVEHFLSYPLTQDEGPGVAYEVERILSGALYLDPDEHSELIEDALRIGETAVQLIGYRDELAWFWSDWLGDQAVRRLTPAERGVWIDLLALAAVGSPTGYVCDEKGGHFPSTRSAGSRTAATPEQVSELIDGILEKGAASRDRTGRLFNRRMVRATRSRWREDILPGQLPQQMPGQNGKGRQGLRPPISTPDLMRQVPRARARLRLSRPRLSRSPRRSRCCAESSTSMRGRRAGAARRCACRPGSMRVGRARSH